MRRSRIHCHIMRVISSPSISTTGFFTLILAMRRFGSWSDGNIPPLSPIRRVLSCAFAPSGPCTSDCGTQGADANNLFYWFDIAAETMTLNQKAKVSHSSLSLLFPTLAKDGRRNIGIGVTGSSSSQYPSAYLCTHLASDSARARINGPFLAHSGTESYSCDKIGR